MNACIGQLELDAIKVELIEVILDFLTVDNERSERGRVETAPHEENHRAFMHEVHSAHIHQDVSGT